MKKATWILLVLLFFINIPTGKCGDTKYGHIYTLESPDQEDHVWFGWNVEVEGEIIALGAQFADIPDYTDAGKLYLYDLEGNLITDLQSPTPRISIAFSSSFDLTKENLVVYDASWISDFQWAGRVHMYTNEGGFLFTLEPPNPTTYGRFGSTLELFENTLVITEIGAETTPGMAGLVHIYDLEGEYIGNISSPEPRVAGRFGKSIEMNDEIIFISEYGEQSAQGPQGSGQVYVFDHDYSHIRTILAPVPEDKACFGSSMSLSGEFIVIGEPFATVDDTFRAGKAYLFNVDGTLLQTIVSPVTKMNGRFGDSVAIDGETIVIGEWDAHVNPGQYEGRAYVYNIDGTLLQNLTAPDPCPRGAFGLDLDVQGDLIVVGECWAASGELGQVGRVQVYELGALSEMNDNVTDVIDSDSEDNVEDKGGIPGFPFMSIVAAIVLFYLLREF